MKEGLILSLRRATVGRTVAWGPPVSPASSPLLAIANFFAVAVGGCPALGSERVVCCGCFPVMDSIGRDKAKQRHAAITIGLLLRVTAVWTAGDAILRAALHLRPL